MSSDYDRWAALRRPLPDWWPCEVVRDSDYPIAAGILFTVKLQGGFARRVRVLRSTLEGISARTIDDNQAEIVWRQHADQITSLAKKIIASERASSTIDITLADLIAGNYDLWPE